VFYLSLKIFFVSENCVFFILVGFSKFRILYVCCTGVRNKLQDEPKSATSKMILTPGYDGIERHYIYQNVQFYVLPCYHIQ